MSLVILAVDSISTCSLGRHTQTARTYSEKVEEYNLRYSYMKSWAGLLRILGVVELLLGAGVFACVTAYIHKDSEWYNMFGYSTPTAMGGIGGLGSVYGGYYYSGPKTPFVLVVAGLAWISTIIILSVSPQFYPFMKRGKSGHVGCLCGSSAWGHRLVCERVWWGCVSGLRDSLPSRAVAWEPGVEEGGHGSCD